MDLLQRRAEALGAQDRRLLVALGGEDLGLPMPLGAQYGRLLLAFGDCDGRLSRAFGFDHLRATQALGGHLPVHRLLDVPRRLDLAYLHLRYLDAPALRYLVQLRPKRLIYALALRENVVHVHLADDRAQRRRGYADYRAVVVHHLQNRAVLLSVHHAHIDQEVYVYRRVVESDVRLARYVQHLLAQIHLLRLVKRPEQYVQPRLLES